MGRKSVPGGEVSTRKMGAGGVRRLAGTDRGCIPKIWSVPRMTAPGLGPVVSSPGHDSVPAHKAREIQTYQSTLVEQNNT